MVSHRRQICKLITVLLFVPLVACNNQLGREAELSGGEEPVEEEVTPELLDFATVQSQVFIPLCQKCHAGTGQFTFENHEVVVAKLGSIENRVFVKQDMPRSGLPAAEKAMLRKWMDEGASE